MEFNTESEILKYIQEVTLGIHGKVYTTPDGAGKIVQGVYEDGSRVGLLIYTQHQRGGKYYLSLTCI